MFMVTFGKDRFIIEVYTGGDSIEYWNNTYHALLDLLSVYEADADHRYCVSRLLREMLPDISDIKKVK